MRDESPTPKTAGITSNESRTAMFVDGRTISAGDVLEADVAIVGGGAAGITLAMELDGVGMRVLLVESGGFELETETQLLCRVRTSAFPISISSGRAFGTSVAQRTTGPGYADPSRRSTLRRTNGSRRAAGRSASGISIGTMREPASSVVCLRTSGARMSGSSAVHTRCCPSTRPPSRRGSPRTSPTHSDASRATIVMS